MNTNNDRKLRMIAYTADIIMFLLHFRLMFSFAGPQTGDAPEYIKLALRAINETGFYPVATDFIGVRYIHNPGMVNWLAVLLRVTDDLRLAFFMNIMFAQVILFSSRYILGRITGSKLCEYIYQILFCIYFSLGISGGIVSAGVEYTFTALTFLGIALVLSNRKLLWPLAGLSIALANYVRPIFAFVLIPVFVFIFCLRRKDALKRIVLLMIGLLVTVSSIAFVSYKWCGRPIYQATTMWSVFIVGNNPIADGNNTTIVFEEGNYGYVPEEVGKNWTCDDYDAYNKELVIDWVEKEPLRVIELIPARLFYFWAVDTYFISAFSDNIEPADKTEYMLDIIHKVVNLDLGSLTGTQWMCIATQAVYMVLLIAGIIAIVMQIRRKNWLGYLGIYVFLLLANGAYGLTYGCARYHFMYMVAMIMLIPSLICYNKTDSVSKENL